MDYTNGQSMNVDTSRTGKGTGAGKGKVGQVAKKVADRAEERVNDTMSSVSNAVSDRTQWLSEQFSGVSDQLRSRAEDARIRTSETVARNPFYAIGVAAFAGLMVGLFLRRGR